MREDIDAKFSALKERLEEKKEKFVGKLETLVKVYFLREIKKAVKRSRKM